MKQTTATELVLAKAGEPLNDNQNPTEAPCILPVRTNSRGAHECALWYPENYARTLACIRLRGVREAQDVLHDILIAAIGAYDERRGKFRALLGWLLYYRTISARSREARSRRILEPLPEDFETYLTTGSNDLNLSEQGEEVTLALEDLAPVDRQIIRSLYWERLTCVEIAERLGMSVAGVKTRAFRSRQWLARQLANGVRPSHETMMHPHRA